MPSSFEAHRAALRARVLNGPGTVSPARREAAARGEAPSDAERAWVVGVHEAPTALTDAQVAALRAEGLDDDAVFELTVAAAVGRADHLLRRARAALDDVFGPED